MSSFIRTPDHLTVMFDDGEYVTIYDSNPRFHEAITAVRNEKWDTIRRIASPGMEITKQFEERGTRVVIEGRTASLDGKVLHNTLTDRMVQMITEGFDVEPMCLFLENLMENPSHRAVNELYTFMEKSDLPITKDGHFVAYKRVRGDYMDIYSGKMDNSVGSTVSMNRNEVDDERNRTCSTGLHFCSRSYLSSYGNSTGNRSVVVKINPRDVVSIPSDYNEAKGRCCRYEVIGELEHRNESPLESAFYIEEDDDLPEYDEEVDEEFEEWETVFEDDVDAVLGAAGTQLHPNYVKARDEIQEIMGADPWIVQVDINTGRVMSTFRTAQDAQAKTSVDRSSIMKVCRGQRKSAGGYGWAFLNNVSPGFFV